MKTPMQELIDRLNNVKPTEFCSIETIKGWAESMLEKEEALTIPDVSLSLLGVAKCPNSNCDNNGTIAYQTANGDWEPEPCEWCHRKNELLNNEV